MKNCYVPVRRPRPGAGAEAKAAREARRHALATQERAAPRGELGVVADASGSAFYECAGTKVICTVRPRQTSHQSFSSQGRLATDVRIVTAEPIDPTAQRTDEERQLSRFAKDALEASIQLARLPKMLVEVHAIVLQRGGAAAS
eukprot:CAMPEP_0118867044 /NCGR_PEP_ID=MMETSP1163-20130328/10775_1 /TAXON_ID=124430 /ORGANISM="Phaeomonas parva, Strain CCMP2877" /LENGTH=143 /DNA_ID=CAMNT_0006801419 /DNA_START=110 /DNA_END=538 /DNA_ORIENTATION=+